LRPRRRIDDAHAAWLALRDRGVGTTHPPEEVAIFRLDPVLPGAARGEARIRDGLGHVEHEGEVGCQSRVRDRGERADRRRFGTAAAALVCLGAIREPVAQDAAPRIESRADHVLHMACACREHDQEFRDRSDRPAPGLEHERAQLLGERRAARLPGDDGLDAATAQVRRREGNLRRLSDALHAFECDERAAHGVSVPERHDPGAGWRDDAIR
jgi:hypothetical protein